RNPHNPLPNLFSLFLEFRLPPTRVIAIRPPPLASPSNGDRLPLPQDQETSPRGQLLPHLPGPSRPLHFDPVNLVGRAQPEMQSIAVTGLVPLAAMDFGNLLSASSHQFHPGADRVAARAQSA